MSEMKKYLENIDDEKLQIVFQISEAYRNGDMPLDEAQQKIREEVGVVEPYEVSYIEQVMMTFEDDDYKKEKIQAISDVFESNLTEKENTLLEDHPITQYIKENDEMRKILLEIEDLVQYPVIKNQWDELYERMMAFKVHLSRKQNQLYSVLERKGFDRPTTIMWTLDDFIRDEINKAWQLLQDGKDDEFIKRQETIITDVRDLLDKEEDILYPTALTMISKEEFADMREGDREIGYAWIDVEHQEGPKESTTAPPDEFMKELTQLMAKYGAPTATRELDVTTGKLTLEQINLIYQHLPVDISYVDEDELVRFYSDTDHRVFPRSKNVIGRKVANCHPRSSVHIVEEILEKFKNGEEDHAEFWINKPDLFIYIYYVAVRDDEGNFRGVLEMMQDCTRIRSLEGSRTLLTWDDETSGGDKHAQETAEKKNESDVKNESEVEFNLDELSADTKLKDLLDAYPFLKQEMPKINDKFNMLNTPMSRIMIPKATIATMSERGEMNSDELIEKIRAAINKHK